jgi:hypothetical protein
MRRPLLSLVMLSGLGCVEQAIGAIEWRLEDGGNGHRYEFINNWVSWADAKHEAELTSYLGLQGHLVTIGSQGENEFIGRNVLQGSYTWIGLTDNEAFGGEESFSFGWPDRQTQGCVWVTDEPISPTRIGALTSRIIRTTRTSLQSTYTPSRDGNGTMARQGGRTRTSSSTRPWPMLSPSHPPLSSGPAWERWD